MTTTKIHRILEALAAAAPPVIDRITKPGPRCVLASRVGQLTLAAFRIEATPFPVELSLFNDAWRQWVDDGLQGGAEEQLRRGAHLLTNTPNWQGQTLPSENPATSSPWDGHLVLRVDPWLIDLDLGQMARPTKQILVPPAVVAPLTEDVVFGTFVSGGVTTYVAYRPLDAPCAGDFVTAGDWKKTAEYTDAVSAIVRRMRTTLS